MLHYRQTLSERSVVRFVSLTKDGKEQHHIEHMIDQLLAANEIDLLAISYPLGGLVFNKEPEREWFRRRFKMLQDILQDSWVYQELLEEGVFQVLYVRHKNM
jgi:hypothetical protein